MFNYTHKTPINMNTRLKNPESKEEKIPPTVLVSRHKKQCSVKAADVNLTDWNVLFSRVKRKLGGAATMVSHVGHKVSKLVRFFKNSIKNHYTAF